MRDPQPPAPPKPRSVAGVDRQVIASLAVQLIGQRLKRMLASLEDPHAFKPHQRHGP